MTRRQAVAGTAVLLGALGLAALIAGQGVVALPALDDLAGGLLAAQREYLLAMRRAVRAFAAEGGFAPLTALLAGAFLYGVLHAAGPGHGKAVIAAYAFADRATLRRGLAATAIASAVQGLSAIALVGVPGLLLGLGRGAIEDWARVVELAATGLVAMFGLAKGTLALAGEHAHHHHHAHDGHAHAAGNHRCHQAGECANDPPSSATPVALWTIALTVGIRPCTGAIVLLLFCLGQGQLLAGVLGTAAMSAGTAITVGALAVAAVYGRSLLGGLATGERPGPARLAAAAERILAAGGWLAVALFAAALFLAAWRSPGTLL